jgi:Arc/MetJ family transcription regulator
VLIVSQHGSALSRPGPRRTADKPPKERRSLALEHARNVDCHEGAVVGARAALAAGSRVEESPADSRVASPFRTRNCLGAHEQVTPCYYAAMAKNLTVRLDSELAADTEALARAEDKSLNETVKLALKEAVERRRSDPEFKARLQRIIAEDRELLERLAK